ncbi:MAG: PhnD/SsuA/transferrin family substrate-binding protein [Thiobacillaceae bacterium]
MLPYLPAAEIERRFSPLAARLGRELGRAVQVRVGQSYQQHIAVIGRDQVDIAYLGPAGYVRMVDRYGRKPILARLDVAGQSGLRSVIVVRHDGSPTRIESLKTLRFAFGTADSSRVTCCRTTSSYHSASQVVHDRGSPQAQVACLWLGTGNGCVLGEYHRAQPPAADSLASTQEGCTGTESSMSTRPGPWASSASRAYPRPFATASGVGKRRCSPRMEWRSRSPR